MAEFYTRFTVTVHLHDCSINQIRFTTTDALRRVGYKTSQSLMLRLTAATLRFEGGLSAADVTVD